MDNQLRHETFAEAKKGAAAIGGCPGAVVSVDAGADRVGGGNSRGKGAVWPGESKRGNLIFHFLRAGKHGRRWFRTETDVHAQCCVPCVPEYVVDRGVGRGESPCIRVNGGRISRELGEVHGEREVHLVEIVSTGGGTG